MSDLFADDPGAAPGAPAPAAPTAADPAQAARDRPLADLLRPRDLADLAGQAHLLHPEAPLRHPVEAHRRVGDLIALAPAGLRGANA